jgi:hypothetical protein
VSCAADDIVKCIYNIHFKFSDKEFIVDGTSLMAIQVFDIDACKPEY